MGIMLPSWLAQALNMVGYEWPSTDESVLLDWSSRWSALSGQVNERVAAVEQGIAHVAGNNQGPAVAAFQQHMSANGTLPNLRNFASATAVMGQACAIGAGIIVVLKLAVMAQLAMLAAAIAAAAATLGLGSAAVLAAREVARRLISAAINLAVSEIMGGA